MLHIDRGIEPGVITVFDMFLEIDYVKNDGMHDKLRILNMVDEDYMLDLISFKLEHLKTTIHSPRNNFNTKET